MQEVDIKGKSANSQVDGADDTDSADKNARIIKQLAELQGDEENSRVEDEVGSSQKARLGKRFKTLMSGWFGRVVCDEGHAAKTIWTHVHQLVSQLKAEHIWFLIATPLYNRAFNISGYLAILYSSIKHAGAIDDSSNDSDIDWFAEYKQFTSQVVLLTLPPYHLLQPKAFVSLFRLSHLMPRDAFWALPPIMRMTCL
ncbi:hypothetical protein IFM61606_10550 [Aspergillus udagawae]|nr:hypothetical protein IFM61606_10550 [Aspergillus udagawae]